MSSNKRIISIAGVLGSPHRHGNTEILLDSFLEGAATAGGSCEKVILSDLDFSSCRGCNACHKTGDCIVNDDILPLYDQLCGSDCIVIASPIYTMGITAETKSFIDRAHYLWVRGYKLNHVAFSSDYKLVHRGYFLSTAGMVREDLFTTAFPMLTALFNILGFSYCSNILADNMDGYGGIRGNPRYP